MNGPPVDRDRHDPALYSYALPAERIAARPARPRDRARLLLVRRDRRDCEHRRVADLPEILDPGDLLVVNETRVVPARVVGEREETGGKVEVLLVHEAAPNRWSCLARPTRPLREGTAIAFPESGVRAIVVRRIGERVELRFEGAIAELLEAQGHVPLPPYIRRPDDAADRADYQTVFAREDGAVAAPTAGLHFTETLLDRLDRRGIALARIVLHVGPGTFRPIRAADVREHRVDPERYHVPEETTRAIAGTRAAGRRVVAVGTTTVRALEGSDPSEPAERSGWTDLTIVPGHRFRDVDALMTNFHLPGSSLLLLVSAFAGRERVLAAYREAVARGYRFYSYGDAMLIL
ncbi:MAG: tRNA preQ1(34) S-adenosylmethionine ribosyltransferase-isomerase QueA [Candidatus Eisenbacteria bacterium]|nr:tRNA preQ1(34) S-adenosylmethionine ribosyltransferase-isomerase QueA [Candidatus Latescibacterota bacterium]MBD3300897.1 tRNA preQ1(34) S-adenosylmethionine ribosyltransferase-isomerase QueA [Candidatus Eisenbacteria bacterium]